jgi:2-amino-4-hydroxy-6-hydroxymethyldihydropteridine diphosphokinase
MPQDVFIGSGSNLGDRLAALSTAVELLAPDVRVLKPSKVYETPPWGYEDQPAFLNQVLQTDTELDPLDLLNYLKRIEQIMGRKATFRYGPRAIDLDILFYDGLIISIDNLQIPHPRAAERAFVLVPLREIAPGFMHPVLNKTITELTRTIDCSGIKVYEESFDGKA